MKSNKYTSNFSNKFVCSIFCTATFQQIEFEFYFLDLSSFFIGFTNKF